MSLATAPDIAARLGRDLGTAETTAVEFLLGSADETIALAAGVDSGDLDVSTAPVLRFVAVELVCRAMANPQGVRSLAEALGQHSSTVQFRDLDTGGSLQLTGNEERLVRKAVHGQTTASPRVRAIINDICDPNALDA